MMRVDLDQPADFTLWPGDPPSRMSDSRSFPTLRAALAAAAEAIDAQNAKPWIITQSGDILAPNWIRAHTAMVGPHQMTDGGQHGCR
jgi:hypothetical protein